MTVKNLKNVAVSIRQKLLNKANAESRLFAENTAPLTNTN
jgi:hypothetical protein